MSYERLQSMYAGDDYYWGRVPNGFARRALELLPRDQEGAKPRAVDIGAGEGRDAVFFAENGLDVLAVDLAPNGLKKALRLAGERGVGLRVQREDVNTLELEGPFDLVYSIGTIQYLSPENRPARFGYFKERTAPGGLHALFAFVDHPGLAPAPDHMKEEHLYSPGELPGYYPGSSTRVPSSSTTTPAAFPTSTRPRSTSSGNHCRRGCPPRAGARVQTRSRPIRRLPGEKALRGGRAPKRARRRSSALRQTLFPYLEAML